MAEVYLRPAATKLSQPWCTGDCLIGLRFSTTSLNHFAFSAIMKHLTRHGKILGGGGFIAKHNVQINLKYLDHIHHLDLPQRMLSLFQAQWLAFHKPFESRRTLPSFSLSGDKQLNFRQIKNPFQQAAKTGFSLF